MDIERLSARFARLAGAASAWSAEANLIQTPARSFGAANTWQNCENYRPDEPQWNDSRSSFWGGGVGYRGFCPWVRIAKLFAKS
jgi:hypothetical protein